jgi:hypothetical protein
MSESSFVLSHRYVEHLTRSFPGAGCCFASSLDVMRHTLLSQPNRSVRLVSIGHATNLVDLLSSPGGAQLVAAKVEYAVWMGGGRGGGEWNFVGVRAHRTAVDRSTTCRQPLTEKATLTH